MWAVAVTAFGLFICEHVRLKVAPSAQAGAQRRGGQSQCLRDAVGAALGLAAHHLATDDLGARTKAIRLVK